MRKGASIGHRSSLSDICRLLANSPSSEQRAKGDPHFVHMQHNTRTRKSHGPLAAISDNRNLGWQINALKSQEKM
jgi:hypothetical protein